MCVVARRVRVKPIARTIFATIFFIAGAAQAESLSCGKLAEANDQRIETLTVGMSKDEVTAIMGSDTCPDTENPAKVSAFTVGGDAIEVLWYKSASKSGLKSIYFRNGKYVGQRLTFGS